METRQMKAIKMTHKYEGETSVTYITYYQFLESFVKERWQGERRTQRRYNMWGVDHTRTTVTNPYSGSKSIRDFDFPKSREQAEQRHKEWESKNLQTA